MNFPRVEKDQVEAFARVYDHNGIRIVIDEIAKTFAMNFANVVLRSFVLEQVAVVANKKRMEDEDAAKTKKSSIILTGE